MRVSVPEAGNALTASGVRVQRRDADMLRRLISAWQSRSFAYYDLLGEIKYAAQFYARGLAPLKLYAAEIVTNPDGDTELKPTNNPKAVAALERIQDPGGGRTGLLSSYGRLMFLAGEAYLFVTKDAETGAEQWEFLSTDELRVDSGGVIIRYRAPSLMAESYREPPDDDWGEITEDQIGVAYRIWQRHPRYSAMADSTMQGVLDLCEELVLLTHAVRARARSRLAGNGILWLDDSMSDAPVEAAGDEDPLADPFLADLTMAMTTPIVDEGSAGAVVPLTVRIRVPQDKKLNDMAYHMQLVDPMQLYPETGLRTECIDRIAIGLDMPPEILKGLQDSNHWTAWQIDEQTWKGHLQPKAQQLCDDLTASYFRPQLLADGVPDFEKYVITYDATDVINHPDRSGDAQKLYDRRAIGKQALRTANGFDEADAPTRDELAEMVGVATRDASLAWFGIPSVKAGGVEPEPGEIVTPDGTDSGGTSGTTDAASTEQGPPPPPESPAPVTASAQQLFAAKVHGACEFAVIRAREVAGNRLLSKVKREFGDELRGVPTHLIPSKLGLERSHRFVTVSELVAGTAQITITALRSQGITDAEIAAQIAERVEQHAARTLFEKKAALPSTFLAFVMGLTRA